MKACADAFVDLANCGERHGFNEPDAVWKLVFGNAQRQQVTPQNRRLEIGIARDDESAAFLAQQFILHGDKCGVRHIGMEEDQVFNLLGGNFLAAAINLVLHAAHDAQIAFRRALDHVARIIKAFTVEDLRIMFGVAIIAAERVRPARGQHSWLAFGHGFAILIDDPDFIVRADRTALGGEDDLVRVVKAGIVDQPLGHAEDLLQLAAQNLWHLPGKRLRKACATHLHEFQRAECCQMIGVACSQSATAGGTSATMFTP